MLSAEAEAPFPAGQKRASVPRGATCRQQSEKALAPIYPGEYTRAQSGSAVATSPFLPPPLLSVTESACRRCRFLQLPAR
jgi:hypothetical protein